MISAFLNMKQMIKSWKVNPHQIQKGAVVLGRHEI